MKLLSILLIAFLYASNPIMCLPHPEECYGIESGCDLPKCLPPDAPGCSPGCTVYALNQTFIGISTANGCLVEHGGVKEVYKENDLNFMSCDRWSVSGTPLPRCCRNILLPNCQVTTNTGSVNQECSNVPEDECDPENPKGKCLCTVTAQKKKFTCKGVRTKNHGCMCNNAIYKLQQMGKTTANAIYSKIKKSKAKVGPADVPGRQTCDVWWPDCSGKRSLPHCSVSVDGTLAPADNQK